MDSAGERWGCSTLAASLKDLILLESVMSCSIVSSSGGVIASEWLDRVTAELASGEGNNRQLPCYLAYLT